MKPGRLRQRWEREQFEPTGLGLLVNPFYFARRGLVDALARVLAAVDDEVLDVGCGRKPYQKFTRAHRYVGVDIDTPATRALAAADVFYDGRRLPFPDASFDTVICSQVLEHVFEPDAFVRELARVLRPGGRLVLSVPFVWDEHEQPQDYARYSSFGLRALLERAGFTLVELRKVTAGPRALAQLGSGWLFKVTHTSNKFLRLAAQLALIAPVNFAGAVLGAALPAGEDFYLDNVVVARKAPVSAP
jgi:SAM-dependent methyltransferase